MTPKEKAIELVNKFTFQRESHEMYVAKHCALICVDEILNQFIGIHNKFKEAKIIDGDVKESANYIYWIEVKQEIEQL
jgi:hypothetical protein